MYVCCVSIHRHRLEHFDIETGGERVLGTPCCHAPRLSGWLLLSVCESWEVHQHLHMCVMRHRIALGNVLAQFVRSHEGVGHNAHVDTVAMAFMRAPVADVPTRASSALAPMSCQHASQGLGFRV